MCVYVSISIICVCSVLYVFVYSMSVWMCTDMQLTIYLFWVWFRNPVLLSYQNPPSSLIYLTQQWQQSPMGPKQHKQTHRHEKNTDQHPHTHTRKCRFSEGKAERQWKPIWGIWMWRTVWWKNLHAVNSLSQMSALTVNMRVYKCVCVNMWTSMHHLHPQPNTCMLAHLLRTNMIGFELSVTPV